MRPPAHDLCQYVQGNLCAFRETELDGRTLDARAMATIQVHLRRCWECREQWTEFESLDALLSRELGRLVKSDFVELTERAMVAGGSPIDHAPDRFTAIDSARGSRATDKRRKRAWLIAPSFALAAAAILAVNIYLQPPRMTDASETSSTYIRFRRNYDFLSSGRLLGSGGAGHLALPLPPTDGLRRGARRSPAR